MLGLGIRVYSLGFEVLGFKGLEFKACSSGLRV